MDDKYVVDSLRISELATEQDNLEKRLQQINAKFREIDTKRNSVANYSNEPMFMGYETLENGELDREEVKLREEKRSIEARISKIKESIGSINEFDAKRDNIELQKQSRDEMREQRKENFEKVKKEWKKRSIWKRGIEHLYGKAPDWKRLSTLSPKKLDYLVKVSQGQTVRQQQLDERLYDKKREDGVHIRDIKKNEENRHWQQFVHDLQTGPSEATVRLEEKQQAGRVR